LFKTEAKLSLRGGDMLFFGVLFPAGVMLLVGFTSSPEAVRLGFAGIATIGIAASGLMGIPLTLSSYRHEKILKRFKVTPASPLLLLSAVTLLQALFAILSGTAVYAIARLVFAVDLGPSAPRFAFSFMAVMLSIYGIGFLIASLAPNPRTANLACSLLYFPALMLSGATVPYEIMPRPLQLFAEIFPLTQGIMILKGAAMCTDFAADAGRFVVLAAAAVLSYLVSLKFFRWE
jgi:ABC-2 type transport system permease protein